MTTIYLYCTKAKPWLCYDEQQKKYALRYGKRKDTDLNGTVCFKCECNEAFKYEYDLRAREYWTKGYFLQVTNVQGRPLSDCLSNTEIRAYGKRKPLWGLHLENVEATERMAISDFYKDEDCTEPLTKAPQSYCHAYRKKEKTIAFDGYSKHDKSDFVEKVIIISIRPKWLCKIANGEKDLEVRKICPKEIERK